MIINSAPSVLSFLPQSHWGRKAKEFGASFLGGELVLPDFINAMDALRDREGKSEGAIYTPWDTAKAMVALAKPSATQTFLEPACGHGTFVFAVLEYFWENKTLTKKTLSRFVLKNVYAVDLSTQSIEQLQFMLSLYIQKKTGEVIDPKSLVKIKTFDGLRVNEVFADSLPFDWVIGNPPYVRTKNLDEATLSWLRSQFKSCKKGNVDLYYAFIEYYCNKSITKNVSFIVPNSFLTNVSGSALCDVIQSSTKRIWDFQDQLVFANARTYTCVMELDNHKDQNATILWAPKTGQFVERPVADVLLSLPAKNKESTGDQKEVKIPIFSGIATLADKVFAVKKTATGFEAIDDKGRTYAIEPQMVVPYLKVTKYLTDKAVGYFIYPYCDRTVIAPSEMKKSYPNAWKYLSAMRAKLDARDRGKVSGYEAWYAYGRKQGLHKLKGTYIGVPTLIGGQCVPGEIDITQIQESSTSLVFSSGFLISTKSLSAPLKKYLLSSAFQADVAKVAKAWAGKDAPYYAINTKLLQSLLQNRCKK